MRFFGAGPWDDLGARLAARVPARLGAARERARSSSARSRYLPRIAELCLLAPMRAFGDRPLAALVDPLRVRPDALARLARESGPAL